MWLRRPGQSWSIGPAVPALRGAARAALLALSPPAAGAGEGLVPLSARNSAAVAPAWPRDAALPWYGVRLSPRAPCGSLTSVMHADKILTPLGNRLLGA